MMLRSGRVTDKADQIWEERCSGCKYRGASLFSGLRCSACVPLAELPAEAQAFGDRLDRHACQVG